MLRIRRGYRPRIRIKFKGCILLFLVFIFFIWELAASSVSDSILLDGSTKHFENSVAAAVKNISEDLYLNNLTYDENNNLKSINFDSASLLSLKSELEKELNKKLCGSVAVWVPIGNLLPFTVTNGIGPKIPIIIGFTGAAQIELEDSFSSGGINQTVYKLDVKVKSTLRIHSNKYEGEFPMETTYNICQFVVVGNTPSFGYNYKS